MRALGLDLGIKTLGIAITDAMKIIASSLENFVYPNGQLNYCVQKIKKILDQYHDIDTIVLGYPLYPSGDKCENTYYVEQFAQQIKSILSPSIKLVLHDERYSTKQATGSLKEIGLKNSKIKKIKDQAAACVILNDWLQWQN